MSDSFLNALLLRKEERTAERRELLNMSAEAAAITLLLNIPGPRKGGERSRRIFTEAKKALFEMLGRCRYETGATIESDGACGPELLVLLPRCREPETMKLQLVGLEERHPLGRLFDLDLNCGKEDLPVGRVDVGIEPRSCFICGEPAAVCARSAAHSPESIEDYLRKLYALYFTKG